MGSIVQGWQHWVIAVLLLLLAALCVVLAWVTTNAKATQQELSMLTERVQRERVEWLRQELGRAGQPVGVEAGAELMPSPELLERLRQP